MKQLIEALDLALEALEYIENNYMSLPKSGSEAITAIKQARSAPVQSCYCPNCEAMGKELAALKAQPTPVPEPLAQNICIECANADSWGLPDKPACRSCVSNSEWKPLNVSSKNPINPPAQPAPVQEPVVHCEAGPEHCQQCHLEDRSLALAAAVRYVKNNTPKLVSDEICMALASITAAQPAPVQEPVWIQPDHLQKAQKAPFLCRVEPHKRDDFVPLYTTPPAAQRQCKWPTCQSEEYQQALAEQIKQELVTGAAQRQWIGLTDEEFEDIELGCRSTSSGKIEAMRKVEAKLKEKNGWYRQHVIDGSPCWCEPETSYTDPETGASVVVHKEPQ